MGKLILCLFAVSAIVACKKDPYEGVGPVTAGPKPLGSLVLKTDPVVRGQEGQVLVQRLEIADEDNPQGPFRIYATGLPAGTEIVAIDARTFEARFSPEAQFVKGQDLHVQEIHWHLISPDRRLIDFTSRWEIENVPVAPYIVGPNEVFAASGLAAFSLLGEDLNGEEFIHFSVENTASYSGLSTEQVLLETDPENIFPTTEFRVKLSASANPEVQITNILIKACSRTYAKCSEHNVVVHLNTNGENLQ